MSDPRPRKRSGAVTLTSLMAGSAISISACDSAPPATQWGDPPAASSGRTVEASSFTSLADCTASGSFTAEQCSTALAQAQKDSAENAPKFGDQKSCEERYGVDQCVPRSSQGGGSFFTPLLTGFIIGQAMNNLGGYRGAPMYRDRNGGFTGGSGYPVSRDYLTGRTRVNSDSFDAPRANAPTRVQSRSSIISRGGFGGGSRSYGG
ncbi:MAG: DUF1190 domain-containing protein [Phenylobacterium sp.]|uniref:DUF1190 domain-containing protein n=2 Tax=Phenylobacterium sp. TaxID=1871053 RepID=UPI00271F1554|nr:DUF1190 domain-containing protein [Phenylobacterium sp.]MDO8323413.1 DUF1190 domain-containing protein [Phenylobacterium sp.]MDO8913921.1 DUF1190 domain-containing protein [Phenylobacterium sp.]MDP3100396.1 DUF1190 domain-containing protein [Phenylobacterium sp.]MDP3866749.1 DUF1190 domain-containing protein [Phenylobacterium sp.]